jgi:hypothetical protein
MATIIITEEQLNRLKLITEDSLGGDIANLRLGNISKGLQGVWRGEGYDYFSYLNSMKKIMTKLNKIDDPNKKVLDELDRLKNKLYSSKMSQTKKTAIVNAINAAQRHFTDYRTQVNNIINKLETKLK